MELRSIWRVFHMIANNLRCPTGRCCFRIDLTCCYAKQSVGYRTDSTGRLAYRCQSRGAMRRSAHHFWGTAVSARTEYEDIAVDADRTRISRPNLLLAELPAQDFA